MAEEVITVHIFDQEYRLKLGAQDPQYIRQLALQIDGRIREFAAGFPSLPTAKLLVLVCLNLADEALKMKESTGLAGNPQEERKKFEEMLSTLKNMLEV